MNSEEYEDILYNNRFLLRSARILGTTELLFFLYLSISEFREEINNNSTSPLLTMIKGKYFLAVTLIIAFIGLIIAYRKESLGGGISLGSLMVLFIGWSDFHLNFILGMGLISLPSLLYLIYGLRISNYIKKAERKSTV